jgi:serine/threonine-protein kinase
VSEVKICPTCNTEYPVSERFCPRDGTALRGQNPEGDLVGTVIADRYHVMKKLGEGGMGTVYLAEHVKMGRKSALKVMNPGMSKDADAIARFNREASNASRLSHPNICAIYDFGETPDGLIYLAMEFIEGESLTAIIEKTGALPPARAASILHQAADGLQVAHDSGIVHRDLKPDNIMIAKGRDGSDVVKVVDFGIAKAHTSDAQKVTKTGLVVGTPEYMSPEQLAGDKLDGRSDIYSLALVGFNMLTGTLPFVSQSAQEAMIMRLTDNPRSLRDVMPDVHWPDQLLDVMNRALARDATQRYQKASDFGREFSMAIDTMPSKKLTEARTQQVGAMRATPNAPTQAIPQTRLAPSSPEKPGPAVEPAPTPVATKNGKGMMIGGGAFAVVALAFVVFKFVISPDNSAAGAGAGATPPNPVPSPVDSGTKPLGSGARGAGSPGGTKVPADTGSRGGGGTPRGGTIPPTGGAGGTGGTRGNANPGAAPVVSPSELVDLKRMADSADVDDTHANRAITFATELLGRAPQGDVKAEILLQRALARFVLSQLSSGCKDLTDARALATTGTPLRKNIEIYFDPKMPEHCT